MAGSPKIKIKDEIKKLKKEKLKDIIKLAA
jgi:hypothetical protein